MMRESLVSLYSSLYHALLRPQIFRLTAQQAHERAMRLLAVLDNTPVLLDLLGVARWATLPHAPRTVGGVRLHSPLILAAGFVKGQGFADEASALTAVERGDNVMPGWRAMPRLVGPVEFGSFTRWPRLGNPGTVLWRNETTRSTQNRVGLKNPGAHAAATFLRRHLPDLPTQMGINIAVSPGVTDAAQERDDVLQSLAAFTERGVLPAWFTLNLSCPNTEDDPGGHQTEERARALIGAVVDYLRPFRIPLWVKLGPDLAENQYQALIGALDDAGASAIIATNTLAQPSPEQPEQMAGVAGGWLYRHALQVCSLLAMEKRRHQYRIDIVGCGGVLDAATYESYRKLEIQAVQYWSALIYRGPLAAAAILHEAGAL